MNTENTIRPAVVLVDDREPLTVRQALAREAANHNAEVTETRLPVADFAAWGDDDQSLGIERKQASDLLGSISAGRLQRQLDQIAQEHTITALIVEGSIEDALAYIEASGHPTGNRRRDVHDYLLSLLLSGVRVVQTKDVEDTARTVVSLARLLDNPAKSPHALAARMTGRPVQAIMLEMVPGIGPGLAQTLLDRFGSLRAVAQASDYELRQIKGLGPTRAQALARVLDRSFGRIALSLN